MCLQPFDIRAVLQRHLFDELQECRRPLRLWAAEIELGASQHLDHFRVIIVEPARIELGALPAIGNDRFETRFQRRNDVEEHAPTVTAGFVTVHFEKGVLAHRQPRG
jgi:hypothetical protein